jgi:hypothetical protein
MDRQMAGQAALLILAAAALAAQLTLMLVPEELMAAEAGALDFNIQVPQARLAS